MATDIEAATKFEQLSHATYVQMYYSPELSHRTACIRDGWHIYTS
jgi:hypothetical protein